MGAQSMNRLGANRLPFGEAACRLGSSIIKIASLKNGSVTDPISGEEVPFIPRRSHSGHQHATPQRLRDLLVIYFASFAAKTDPKGRVPVRSERAWERLVSEGTCCGLDCQTDDNVTRTKGMVLLGGHLLCPLCHRKWEAHVRKEMGFSRNPCCPRRSKSVV